MFLHPCYLHFSPPGEGTIITDTQHPQGLEKIRKLEDQEPHRRPEVPDTATKQRPMFTKPLQNIDAVEEGKNAHFSCRLIPVGDPTLKVLFVIISKTIGRQSLLDRYNIAFIFH